MARSIQVAIFGIGRMGEVHLRHLADDERVDIRYLVDIPSAHEKIRSLISRYRLGNVEVLDPARSNVVMEDKSVSAVFICTLVDVKVDIIKASLRAGKHVFCEKPISLQTDLVEECYSIAKECGKVLQCGFNKRFDVSVRSMYDKIRRGDIGRLRMIKLTAREMPALVASKEYILSSGGLFIDSIIHEFDLVSWLAGERPCDVFAFGHAHNPLFAECGDIDSATIILKFPSGLMGFIESFRGVNYGHDQRFEVLGTEGMLVNENPRTTLTEAWDDRGQTKDTVWQGGITRYHDAYRAEVVHFLDVVQGKATCDVLGEEVVFVNKLANSAAESYRTGKAVTIL